jgi:hypothetical protein
MWGAVVAAAAGGDGAAWLGAETDWSSDRLELRPGWSSDRLELRPGWGLRQAGEFQPRVRGMRACCNTLALTPTVRQAE